MKTKVLPRLFTTIIAMFIIVPAAFGQSCSSDGGFLIAPGQGVSLSQITYTFDAVSGTEPSATGSVDANVPQLTTLMSNGFINIVTSAGWVTQNLPIMPGYPYAGISTDFSLGVAAGTTVSSLNAVVCYSPDPFAQMPSDTSYQTFDVASADYNAQGECPNDGEGAACLVSSDPLPPAIGIVFPGGVFSFKFQPNHQMVQTADNQCAPAAFASNFTWLKTTYGVPIPDPNVVGLRNIQNNNSLVGKLDMAFWSGPNYPPASGDRCGSVIGRYANVAKGLFGRVDGCATTSYWQTIGSLAYLANNNIFNLTLYHQGSVGRFSGANDIKLAGLASIGKGAIVDPNFIFSEISGGTAIKGGLSYPGGGGHAVSIIAAGSILGAPFIAFLHDGLQTPDDLMDNKGIEIKWTYLCQPGRGQNDPCKPDPTKASPIMEQYKRATLTNLIMQHP